MNTLAPSFLSGSSSFLQVTRTCMKAWVSSNFGKLAIELRPLVDVRIKFLLNILKTNRPIKTKLCIHTIIDKIYVGNVNHCLLLTRELFKNAGFFPGERSLPFGLLVCLSIFFLLSFFSLNTYVV